MRHADLFPCLIRRGTAGLGTTGLAASCLKTGLTIGLMVGGLAVTPALALDEGAKEKENLDACEKSICELLVKKDPAGGDYKCDLSKTWGKDKIKSGVEGKKIGWTLGDARCNLSLTANRQSIVDALSKPEYELKMDAHTVKCEVERDKEVTAINISMAPKLQMKDGKVVKAWLGIGTIEAPAAIKGAIWTVAQMEDTFGVFHSDLVKEVNKFVSEKCPKRLAK
jgi:hypothetical protein